VNIRLWAAWIFAVGACGGDERPGPGPDAPGPDDPEDPTPDDEPGSDEDWNDLLASRQPDYGAALRTATLRLRGELPTLVEVRFVADAVDPRAAYEAIVDTLLEDPRLGRELVSFFRDTFKMGETTELDGAPVFAAQLAVEDRSYLELFTARNGTCPTWDPETMTFTAGDCDNGLPLATGVLTNPGFLAHFDSNLAFRRVRWVQETFACTKFPAEVTRELAVGDEEAVYTAPWDWESIGSPATGGRVDFLDTSSIICANCHATMNHVAPLFARFDSAGQWVGEIVVTVPTEGLPVAIMEDWLPPGHQETAWRFGQRAPDLPALGAAMADDPAISECAVARVWNFALGRGDVIAGDAEVPSDVIAPTVRAFELGGHRLREALRAAFTSDDFVTYPRGATELLDGASPDGPVDVMARLHGCPKMKYATLGRVLQSRGVNLQAEGATSAGALWRTGDQALGAPQYGARVPESLELTTASASRLFDIFVQAAPEIIEAMPERAECMVGGEGTPMFGEAGHCTADGIACLTGLPATPAHLEMCNEIVARASSPEVGHTLAVATLASAAHTCE
jgi:hypothetical protein